MEKKGALPAQEIHELMARGAIANANAGNVQPASLDLTLSEEIYRVDALFLPRAGERVRDAMEKVRPVRFAREEIFEVGIPYLARLNEVLSLPADIYAYVNPKSTTGRNDVKVSLVADGVSRFDSAGLPGFRGELWAFIEPKSFRIRLPANERLLQIRFFNGDTRLREDDLKNFYFENIILFNDHGEVIPYDSLKISDRDGGLILTVNLKGNTIGYVCHGSRNILDFSKRRFYPPEDFFEPIQEPSNGMLFLRQGSFYVFYTCEFVRVPPSFACEMAPVDIRNGEYRSHYAGYIDPGWGYSKAGEVRGRPLVLEVRPFDANIMMYHGQPVCKLIFERMRAMPKIIYGEEIGSSYFLQAGPVLSKHFDMAKIQ